MKILFMNSGGKDSNLALNIIKQQNPNAEIHSLTIEVADQKTLDDAGAIAKKHGVASHFVLPYEQTRQYIKGKLQPETATLFWYFEIHFKGIQYAASNDFDFVATGGDATPIFGDFDDLLNRVMDCMKLGRKVGILRPLRNVASDADFQAMLAKYGAG